MKPRYYRTDAKGEPVECFTAEEWARWFRDGDRHVASTMVGAVHVSTVFLGLDHRFYGSGPPVLWETMIFGLPEDTGHQWRYTSRADALAGHLRAVFAMRERFGVVE